MNKGILGRIALLFASLFFGGKEFIGRAMTNHKTGHEAAPPGKIYSFEIKSIDGKPVPLARYKGQVLLVVNTASRCGFTPQYQSLEKLQEKYKDRGLKILAFPANNFGAQEPGSDAEIKSFCAMNYGASFDLFSKISVAGEDIHPLYLFLTTQSGFNGPISWNFNKFLVDRAGGIAARFGPTTDPLEKSVLQKIDELLNF